MKVKNHYSWDRMIEDFRELGGIADNIVQRVGAYGNGIFPINPQAPVNIEVPDVLLIDADQLILRGDDLIINPDLRVDSKVREFYEKYQKHFSWGGDGRRFVETFELDLKTLPSALLERLQEFKILNIEKRHEGEWGDVLRRCFLQSRKISYNNRKVVMPIIELINHGAKSQAYSIKQESIGFSGFFSGELTVNYSPTSDSLARFINYGFANQEPQAFSFGLSMNLSDGTTLSVGNNAARIVNKNGFPVPEMSHEGKERRLAHLRLGMYGNPRIPRALLRMALPDFQVSLVDEIFDRIRNVNQVELCRLLELANEVDTTIGKTFRQAIIYQLNALTYCYGVRSESAVSLS